LLLAILGYIEFIWVECDWFGGIRIGENVGRNLNKLLISPFIGLDTRTFGGPIAIGFGRENNLKPGAVTDSKLLFFKRSLSAASARFYAKDFKAIRSGRMQPENMTDFGMLGNVAKIKNRFGNSHGRIGSSHTKQPENKRNN